MASVGTSSLKSFFCHNCEQSFKSQEAVCQKCQGEFVEEVEEIQQTAPPPPKTRTAVEEVESRPRQRDQLGEMLGQYLVQLISAREQLEDSENYTLPVIPPPPQFLELMFRGHQSRREQSSARTPGSLDTVIARLLEQLVESGGPPPADEDKIHSLPTSIITQKQVDEETECSICKELFVLNDDYKRLPCTHLFHSHCIVAWLKIHDTCPTCRFSLNKGRVPE